VKEWDAQGVGCCRKLEELEMEGLRDFGGGVLKEAQNFPQVEDRPKHVGAILDAGNRETG